MQPTTVHQRQTKYCDAIEHTLNTLGHATNAELLQSLRATFPDVSATTVHRATARLADRGAIGFAPPSPDGSMRYDGNIAAHDHFMCSECGMIRDADVVGKVIPILESSIGGCNISGRLSISGICNKCKESKS